ncbi:MAG: hypothetical protein V4612_06190 [Pseudomonadota bacterium]
MVYFSFNRQISGLSLLLEIIDVVAILNALRLIWKKDFNSDIKD